MYQNNKEDTKHLKAQESEKPSYSDQIDHIKANRKIAGKTARIAEV